MPTTAKLHLTNGANGGSGYSSKFSHKDEKAKVGYYTVLLEDYNVVAELTASQRVGFHKYTFNTDKEAQLILDLEHRDKLTSSNIEVISNNNIQGWRHSSNWAADQRLYFYIQLSKDISEIVYREDSLVAAFKFGEIKNQLLVKIGISAISIENANFNE